METKDFRSFHAKTRAEWRQWLEQNHDTEKSVWLILYHKASKMQSIYYDDAVEEALCFGWIDGRANKRDDESFYILMSQRKPKSNWSRPNKERVAKLTELGLMTPAGQAMIDLAKETGTWDALVDVENNVVPPDLQQQFDANPTAFTNFMAFAPSARRIMLGWIMTAKQAETRQRRIDEVVAMAEKNLKAYPKKK